MSETTQDQPHPQKQKQYISANDLIKSIFDKNTDINLAQKGLIESTARSYRYRHKYGKLDLNAQRNMLRALGYEDMQLTVNPYARKPK